jgi:uncharacterized surface protein with fasciclin (FAS1) repeats
MPKYLIYTAALCLSLFSACKKEAEHAEPLLSLTEYIAQSPELTLLHAAMQRTHMDTAFVNGGNFTFFTPVDSAFIRAGLTLDKIQAYDPVALSNILKYHIGIGRINGTELLGFFKMPLFTLYTAQDPMLTKNYYGIFVNGNKVMHADIQVANGVVQEIGQVMIPPIGNLLEVLKAQPDLTYMSAFFDLYEPARTILLNNRITLLAPSDEAWKAYGFATLEAFRQADMGFLYDKIIGYYIGGGDAGNGGGLFTSDFMGGYRYFPYDRATHSSTMVFTDDGVSLMSTANIRNTKLIRINIPAIGGSLHVMDQVHFITGI